MVIYNDQVTASLRQSQEAFFSIFSDPCNYLVSFNISRPSKSSNFDSSVFDTVLKCIHNYGNHPNYHIPYFSLISGKVIAFFIFIILIHILYRVVHFIIFPGPHIQFLMFQ